MNFPREHLPGSVSPRRVRCATLLAVLLQAAVLGAAIPEPLNALVTKSAFLPDFYTQSDISRYVLQKKGYDDYFHKRYFVDFNILLGFPLYSFAGVFFHTWELEVQAGMGQTPNNAVFDPMDASYAVVPMVEARLARVTAQAGLDHRCFHEVDRKDFLTTYYNRAFLAVGSPNYRRHDFRRMMPEECGWFDSRRFAWYIRGGWYVKDFPGAKDTTKINYNNDNVLDANTVCTYALLHRPWVTLCLSGTTRVGYLERPDSTRAREGFWRQDVCLEADFPVKGVGGMMVFVNYTRDHLPLERGLPRFSKDQLLQVGLRFSN